MATISIHSTPNPNSLKFVAEEGLIIPSGMLAFGSREEASEHELGRALFGLDGVTNVFALPEFLTVTKSPASDWNSLVDDIKRITGEFVGRR